MSSLSPSIQSVVQLFRGPLAGVRFADIDAAGITNLAAEVESIAAEVESSEAKLSELKQSLAQRNEALLGLAQQALAYARIYAEGDDALTAELAQIALPRPAKPRKKEAPSAVKAAEPTEAAQPTELEASDAAPVSTETVTALRSEAEAAEEGARAIMRRARGRAKTGTART
jgi:hypothetical protein